MAQGKSKREENRERLERRQRMLAREQGKPYTGPGAAEPRGNTTLNGTVRAPRRVSRTAPAQQPLHTESSPAAATTKTKDFDALLHRRKRKKHIFFWLFLLIAAVVVAYYSGLFTSAAMLAGDAFDSAVLYMNRADASWPVRTGIHNPTHAKVLAGGFVEMDGSDIAIYSPYGSKIRAIQPGYARPALAVGNARFAVYNRTGNEVRIESRSKSLRTLSFQDGILLCAMSNNGSLAVVTESVRYAAELQIFDPTFRSIYSWKLTQADGTPLSVAFAPDNRRFAAGTVAAKDGQLCTSVYMMDTADAATGPVYTADAGSMIIELKWLSPYRLLAVFDTYAVILDPSTATEAARYDYGGATLQSVSVGDTGMALLLVVRGGNTLVTLNENLGIMAMIPAGQADRVDCVDTEVYLLTGNFVECYGYEGTQKWQKSFSSHPVAVLDAQQPLVFCDDIVDVLTPPEA